MSARPLEQEKRGTIQQIRIHELVFNVDNGKQAGPVDDLQLQQLAGAGVIRLDTLVWREGMANWQPYSQAVPAGSGAYRRRLQPTARPGVRMK